MSYRLICIISEYKLYIIQCIITQCIVLFSTFEQLWSTESGLKKETYNHFLENFVLLKNRVSVYKTYRFCYYNNVWSSIS